MVPFNHAEKPVILIGSKPDARLPAIEPQVVLGANNAVEVAVAYRERYGSKVIGIINADIMSKQKLLSIQESLIKSKPDEVVFLGKGVIEDPVEFIHIGLGLSGTKVSSLTNAERHALMTSFLGLRSLLVILNRVFQRGFRGLVPIVSDYLGRREWSWMSRSTGLNGVFYALSRYPGVPVITAGISLEEGSHFNHQGAFKAKAAKVDQLTIRYWPKHKRPMVYTTDERMSTIGDVPIWEGEVFTS